jgi:uncharacterized membrane protein
MNVQDAVTINAPVERVWDVYADVERWPEWTASVSSLELLDHGALALGSRARIKQPRFPRLVWTVTAVEPGTSWTWVTRSPGAVTTATHTLVPIDATTTRVEQTIDQAGPIGALVGRLTARLTRRYLAMEAAGLKHRAEAGVTSG